MPTIVVITQIQARIETCFDAVRIVDALVVRRHLSRFVRRKQSALAKLIETGSPRVRLSGNPRRERLSFGILGARTLASNERRKFDYILRARPGAAPLLTRSSVNGISLARRIA